MEMKNIKSERNNLPDAEYLTRRESALFLRISLASFDNLKDIERIKYGKSVRFSIRALRDYAAKHTIKEADDAR
jgi:hypothetical protein